MQIDHVNIKAPYELLVAVKEFYCNLLAFEVGPRPASARRGFWLYAGERPLIHLSEDNDNAESGAVGHFDHVAFRVDDLEVIAGRLDQLHVPYRTKHVPELNMRQIFFKDPAGVGVEVNGKF